MHKPLLLLALLVSTLAYSQTKLDPRLQLTLAQQGVSLRQASPSQQDSTLYKVFLYFSSTDVAYTDAEIVALGGKVDARFDDFLMVRVPASAMAILNKDPRVVSLEGDQKITSKQTKAVQHDSVAAWMTRGTTGTSYTPTKMGELDGSGVLVGVCDGGFDFSSPAFLKEDEEPTVELLRVKGYWYYDKEGNCTFYPSQKLIKAYDKRNSTHATHVAAIAAGSKVELRRGKDTCYWSGIAPKADLLFAGSDDGYYASSDYSWYSTILGVQQFFHYADSVKKPCVVNLSLGCNIGRHDDTHPFAIAMKSLIDNKPGHIVCVASSNEGDMNCSFKDSIRSVKQQIVLDYDDKNLGDEAEYEIYNMTDSSSLEPVLYIWCWNQDSTDRVVVGQITEGETITLKDTAECVIKTSAGGKYGNKRVYIVRATPNNKNVHFNLSLSHKDYAVEVRGYSDYPAFFTKVKDSSISPNNQESISPLACNNYVISVGSYTTYDGKYISYNLDTLIALREGETLNQVTSFTSYGYDWNNIYRPDVLCPGVQIESYFSVWDTTVYNQQTGKIQNDDVTIAYGNSILGVMSGTSMATPHMAGVVALMLQNNPKLTVADIRTYLKNSNQQLPNPTLQSQSGRLDAIALAKQAGINIAGHPSSLPATHYPLHNTPSIKYLKGGQLYILHNNQLYNAQGAIVK